MSPPPRTTAVAALLGADATDHEPPGYADALPPADADADPGPDDYTFDPGTGDDEFDAFVSTFELGNGNGPLADWRIGVKDNIAVAGVPLTAGAAAFSRAMPARHAPVVSRLLDAGARITGKTNMDELAYGPTGETSGFGPTRNPRQPAHVAGGSSAGSGAAVAAGVVDAALGTDTGGSVRIPASFCGVVGYKPTYGLVPRVGVVPLAGSLDHVGVLARSVADAASVADVIAGVDARDPTTAGADPDDLRSAAVDPPVLADCSFALAEEFLGDHVDPAVRGRVERAVDAVEAAGATVEHVAVPRFESTAPAWTVLTNVELATGLLSGLSAPGMGVDAAWHAAAAAALDDGAGFGDRLTRYALDGAALLDQSGAAAYHRALAERDRFREGFRAAIDGHDALLAPTMPVTAPAVGEWSPGPGSEGPPLSVNVRQANLAGAPALSLPCGRVQGLPVGLQLVGVPGADARLLAVARAVEDELDAYDR